MKKTQVDLFLKRLEDACFAVHSNVSFINHGGCCVFASYMGKKLQELGIPVRIRTVNSTYLEDNDEDSEEMGRYVSKGLNISEVGKHIKLNSANEWYKNGVDLYHVLVEFDLNKHSYMCDSTGLDPYLDPEDESLFLCEGSMPVEWAEVLANEPNAWNPLFKRKDIPKIKAILDFRFIKLERLYRGLDKH